jgi:tRNA/rRNA methyltransferase
MLSAAARARLSVVLVGARNPGNIGAAARAIRDFGFHDLRVVNEYAPPFEAAQLAGFAGEGDPAKAAVGAGQVLAEARRFDRLEEAIADCALVVGTTAIGERGLARPVLPLRKAAPAMLAELAAAELGTELGAARRVALLFGSEKTGLTNEQLSHCQLLLTIPMFAPEGERHLSMNLGQSVAVCLYELVRSGFEGAREIPAPDAAPATAAMRERLMQLLLEAMEVTDYARRFPANARETVVRQMAQRLAADEAEATAWMGFLRQVVRGSALTRDPTSD